MPEIPEPSQPLGDVENEPNTLDQESTKEEKVWELEILLDQFMTEKKESNKTYNAEIKRVKAEIKALIRGGDEETPTPNTNEPTTPVE